MAHPRVEQFRFARAEWVRGLRGLSEEDGVRRLEPMNSISWMVGHLAWHERLVWLERGLGLRVEPLLDAVANGQPASTPSLAGMWAAWERVTARADAYLDTLTTADLVAPLPHDTRPEPPAAGSQLQRITYHYWSHIGEASAVRQILGHARLAQFVGAIERDAPYRPEDD
ncbi:MAG TPA: DinB family protein [Candidatus Limnocylindrales bacterium]